VWRGDVMGAKQSHCSYYELQRQSAWPCNGVPPILSVLLSLNRKYESKYNFCQELLTSFIVLF
jgi:hypothetical protein